jgi:ABC-type branched-subunit amino acid transport system ATPase component
VDDALQVADHIYVMTSGRVVFDGNPEAFRANRTRLDKYVGIK